MTYNRNLKLVIHSEQVDITLASPTLLNLLFQSMALKLEANPKLLNKQKASPLQIKC